VKFRRLRLAGFKSFVDPVDLWIEDGLTGVVGPNGCGKSNLLEAIRWVMGESSPKSMRGGGMDDVIFAGTDRRPPRDMAQVTLYLDNSARRAPAQFNESDEIEIGRHIERGLGSVYRINGRDVRLRDVQLLFADAATGAHSPALVSQGRIGAIIAAKPQDRRQLLEEAAGIAGLHVRRKDAEQRLRAAEANLIRLDDVLQGLATQAASLKRQAKQAERYRKISGQIRTAEAMLLYAKWREANAEVAAAAAAAAALRGRIDDATRLSATLSARQADATAALPPLRDAEVAAAAVLQRLSIAREALAAELAEVGRRRREAELQAETARRDLEREHTLAADAAAALARLADEAAAIDRRLADVEAAVAPAEARITALEAAAVAAEANLSQALAAQAHALGQRRAHEAERVAAASERARADADRERAEVALATSGGDDIAARIADAEARAARADAAAAAAMRAIADAEARRGDAEALRDAVQATRAGQQAALSALTVERASLERMLAAPACGGEPLIDRVGVRPGYEMAFAAAFGDEAAAVVGGDSGPRWTGALAAAGDPALPAGARPLAGVIDAPAEIARRLAQVGVVDAVDFERLASSLAVGQRLVTTDGRLARWDGFRADGDGNSAAAETLRRRNRLAELDDAIPAAKAALAAADTDVDAARATLATIAAAIDSSRAALREAEATRAEVGREIADLAGRAERQAAQIEALRATISRAAEVAGAAGARIAAADQALAVLPAPESLADTVTAARDAFDGVRSDLAEARAERASLQRGLDADAARRRAIDAERADWERRTAGSAAQRAELTARIDAARAVFDELAGAPAVIEARQTALAGDIAAAEADRQAAADRLAEAESALRALDSDVRAATEALSTLREERGRLDARVENHELRRAELNRIASERFQCSPQMLPEQLGFAEDDVRDAATQSDALERLTAERERMGPVNLRADVELAEIETNLATSTTEREELETAIARLRGSIGSLNREGRARLLTAFEEVGRHFADLFTTLFGGGEARLELVESDDLLEAGLEIMAQPPGKKLQAMTLLSGGEQALTAIALIFALFLTNPAPICVLDEVDAPLDDANIERFCDLLDCMTALTDTRFLIVTHNAVTMSRMHRLYGVTMAEKGVSQLVSVDLGHAETLLAAE
jgi:chromosome segregation protein